MHLLPMQTINIFKMDKECGAAIRRFRRTMGVKGRLYHIVNNLLLLDATPLVMIAIDAFQDPSFTSGNAQLNIHLLVLTFCAGS